MAQTNPIQNNVSSKINDVTSKISDMASSAGAQSHTHATEGNLTKAIEQQTAKIPSVGFLGLAIGSMAISIGLELFSSKRRDPANFVGLWVPTFLLFGIYNKLVKLEGSDHMDKLEHKRAS